MDPAEPFRAGPDRLWIEEPAGDPDFGRVAVTWTTGGAGSSWAAGGGGGTARTTIAGLAAYANNLQENLVSAGFMDPEVSHSVHIQEGVRIHVRVGEKRRKKRFDQLLKASSEKAAAQVCAISGLPRDWDQILARGPREGTWPRTDWDWVACFEWEVWKQVFDHSRDYEKEVAKLGLTWREKAIVRIASTLWRVKRWKSFPQGK